MSQPVEDRQRTVGLLGATGVGVGAIVGGGIMVLAGVAYQNAGPAALLAFGANGLVAFLTAMSFAEISTSFPESGGAYTFAKKVLSVRAAFAVGWILWFAYIVAGVLYALGFATFALEGVSQIFVRLDRGPPSWLASRHAVLLLSTAAVAMYALSLIRKSTGGGQFATIGKLIVFAVLIGAGINAFLGQPLEDSERALTPFFAGGGKGLIVAMGFTFIALQGFDLIAAIAGEVRRPERTIPRAMFLSLGCALVVYLPILFLLATVGVEPGGSISALAEREGDTVFAAAVSHYMGPVGYWLVIVAAVLSTLSALHANILAASRVAHTMARDRVLPSVLGVAHRERKTPVMAIYATVIALIAILFMVPDLGSAGAAASLIFLVSFALAHGTAYLARVRMGESDRGFRTPLFPLIPVVGGLACVGLAGFQAFMVPSATQVAAMWLGLGTILYFGLFRRTAETADASAEAHDPMLAKLRGRTPLVLLPVANPANARALVEVANAMAPTEYARVLLLSIVRFREGGSDEARLLRLEEAQKVVREALKASYSSGQAPEALITAAPDPWKEIQRIAEEHRCDSLLIGLRQVAHDPGTLEVEVERLINEVDCDVAIMRAPPQWSLEASRRILVPVGGLGQAHELRARVLGSICRAEEREVTFVTVLPTDASEDEAAIRSRNISGLAEVKVLGKASVEVLRSDDPAGALLSEAERHDLIVLGLMSVGWGRKAFGEIALRIAREAPCATMMLSRRRSRAYIELYKPLREAVTLRPV